MAYSDSAADRLTAVREAIGRALEAQSYTVRGRGKVTASLKDLRELEKQLMQEVKDAAGGGGMCSVGQLVPPS